jgi:hypothetical protein
VLNARMAKTGGWQEFKFEPVTAKNYKIKIIDYEDWDFWSLIRAGDQTGFQILGSINP